MKNWRKYLYPAMVVAGLGLLAYDPIMSFMVENEAVALTEQKVVPIEEVMAKTADKVEPEEDQTSAEIKPVERVIEEEEAIVAEEEKTEEEKFLEYVYGLEDPTEPVDTYWDKDSNQTVVGKVAIPDVNLSLAILKGVGQENGDPMIKGATTNKLGQEMGKRNYVLSSHAVKNPTLLFSPLFGVEYGNKVYLTDEKNVYIYEVTDIDTVEPTDVEILDDIDGKKMVTLYTCTQAGTKRLVVKGELVDTVEYNNESAQYFE